MGRNTQISIEDNTGQQIAIYKVPYGAKLYCSITDDEVKTNVRKFVNGILIQLPVIAEKSGIANYM